MKADVRREVWAVRTWNFDGWAGLTDGSPSREVRKKKRVSKAHFLGGFLGERLCTHTTLGKNKPWPNPVDSVMNNASLLTKTKLPPFPSFPNITNFPFPPVLQHQSIVNTTRQSVAARPIPSPTAAIFRPALGLLNSQRQNATPRSPNLPGVFFLSSPSRRTRAAPCKSSTPPLRRRRRALPVVDPVSHRHFCPYSARAFELGRFATIRRSTRKLIATSANLVHVLRAIHPPPPLRIATR